MNKYKDLTKDGILEDEVYEDILDVLDPVKRADLVNDLLERAKELNKKDEVKRKYSAYLKLEKEANKKVVPAKQKAPTDNLTAYDYPRSLSEYRCGCWIADEQGVRTYNLFGEVLACYHPILIVDRYVNAETGKEKVKLAFRKGTTWREITVDKAVIASSSKIVGLADYGVSVTSETAKNLVRFLADLENLNLDLIETKTSTSKFGWCHDYSGFIPYTDNIEFDARAGFRDLVDAVSAHGSRDKWYDLVKEIRTWNKKEIAVYMAASFGSVLLEPLKVLPFIVNLWAETGKGKTVNMMIAASIWANPAEGKYITDPCGTDTAREIRNNILNNLPTMIDDLSKMREKYGYDAVTDFVYTQCGGKGKDRSNRELTTRETTRWKNITLTNIERPLTTEHMKGGAVNRILDFEMAPVDLFQKIKGNAVCKILTANYGFAGKEFINAVIELGFQAIADIQNAFYTEIEKLTDGKKEEKQLLPLSVLLTADKIATDYLFKDGLYMNAAELVDDLKDREAVSEYQRAYDYICSELAVNCNHFLADDTQEYVNGELWGRTEGEYHVIYKSVFDRICEGGNISPKGFLSWAASRGLIVQSAKHFTAPRRIGGNPQQRCVILKTSDESDFLDASDEELKALPFQIDEDVTAVTAVTQK